MANSPLTPVSDDQGRLEAAFAGRYHLLRELGRGGMATVWLAEDCRHGRQVAVKVLRPELAASIGSDRFLREIEVATSLTHPHILPLHESGELGGFLYYVMPFVAGTSLRDRLRKEIQLPLDDALRITSEVAGALDYAHRHGLVHRDVKPENILLDDDHAFVADFGVARAIETAATDRLTATGLAVGTPAYMSPEQAAGSERLDGRSDLYSLGCVLFEMLAGEPPFTAPTPQVFAAKHLSMSPPSVRLTRATVPRGVERALARALAKVPADRYSSAEEFAAAVNAVSTDREQLNRGPIRSMALGTAAIALLLVIALVWGRGYGFGLASQPEGRVAPQGPARVAVLYFDDLTPDSSLGRLADGLTEELINELSGVDAFRVISRNGVAPYRGRRVPLDNLVATLRVNDIVDGSIQRAGDGVRVRVQLVDGRTYTYIDSLSLTVPLTDPVTFQRETAVQLAGALRRQLGREARLLLAEQDRGVGRSGELVVKAHRAREDAAVMVETSHPEDLQAALETLTRADSLLRLAHQEDSAWTRPLLDRGWVAEDRARLLGSAERKGMIHAGLQFAEDALHRAPGSAEALELRGTLRWLQVTELANFDRDLDLARDVERDLRQALDRDSTRAGAWATLSYVLWFRGRLAESGLAARRALQQDAYLTDARDVLGQLFFNDLWLGNFRQAAVWCRRGRLSFPNDWRFMEYELTLMGHDITARPQPTRAWALVDSLTALDPPEEGKAEGRPYHAIYRRVVAATISARAGRSGVARMELARALRATAGDSALRLDLAYDEASLRLALGQRQQAIRLLRDLMVARPLEIPIMARDPLLKGLNLSD